MRCKYFTQWSGGALIASVFEYLRCINVLYIDTEGILYSGASFIRTLWFPVKIVRIGEASGYLKCYDLSLKKKIMNTLCIENLPKLFY